MKRFARPLMAAATVIVLVAGGIGTAGAVGTRIGPRQYFAGAINGRRATSSVSVTGCSATGGDGRPLAGQSVEVVALAPPTTSPVGYTGRANRVSVDLEIPSTDPMLPLIRVVHLGQLNSYGTPLAISAFLRLPCQGTATAVLSPVAGGSGDVASDVRVTFASPRIVAKPPLKLAPGTTITLTGSGFAPDATYHLVECPATSWVVPQNPCDVSNAIDVTTGGDGGFTHPFSVQTCIAPTAALIESCYLGVPMISGIDTVELVGWTKITVQRPTGG